MAAYCDREAAVPRQIQVQNSDFVGRSADQYNDFQGLAVEFRMGLQCLCADCRSLWRWRHRQTLQPRRFSAVLCRASVLLSIGVQDSFLLLECQQCSFQYECTAVSCLSVPAVSVLT